MAAWLFYCSELSTGQRCPHGGLQSGATATRSLYRRSMAARPAHSAQKTPATPRRAPLGRGTPGPMGDTISRHTLSNGEQVVIRRTARRKTGLAAFWEAGQAVIAVPARLSVEDELYWVPRMVAKLEQGTRTRPHRSGSPASDDALLQRSLTLSGTYLGARAVPVSVRWVQNQQSRWGSATPARRTIRISHHVQGMPEWVLDYVLLHELAHLIHPNPWRAARLTVRKTASLARILRCRASRAAPAIYLSRDLGMRQGPAGQGPAGCYPRSRRLEASQGQHPRPPRMRLPRCGGR